MNKIGNALFWVVVIGFVIIAVFIIYTRTGGKSQGQVEQKAVAADFALGDINGKAVKLSDYKEKIVVLNFWATWCEYCVKEMPDIDKVNTELLKRGDTVVLGIDEGESADVVKKFISDNKLSLPILMDGSQQVANDYDINGLPTTYIINKDGTIADKIEGETSEPAIIDALSKLK